MDSVATDRNHEALGHGLREVSLISCSQPESQMSSGPPFQMNHGLVWQPVVARATTINVEVQGLLHREHLAWETWTLARNQCSAWGYTSSRASMLCDQVVWATNLRAFSYRNHGMQLTRGRGKKESEKGTGWLTHLVLLFQGNDRRQLGSCPFHATENGGGGFRNYTLSPSLLLLLNLSASWLHCIYIAAYPVPYYTLKNFLQKHDLWAVITYPLHLINNKKSLLIT